MKRFLTVFAPMAAFCGIFAADLTTNSGVTYENYKIDAATDRGLVIYHERGMATIAYSDLPDAVRAKYAKEEADAVAKQQNAAQAAEEAAAAREQRQKERQQMLDRTRGAQVKANKELEKRIKTARTIYGSNGKCVVCLGNGRYWAGIGLERQIQRCVHCKGKGIKRVVDVGEMKFRDLPVRIFRCNKKEVRNDSIFKLSTPTDKSEGVGEADFCGKVKVDQNMIWDVYYQFDKDDYLRKVTFYYTVDHDRNPYGAAKRLKFDQIQANLITTLAAFNGKDFGIPPKPVKTKVTRVPKAAQNDDPMADPGMEASDPAAEASDPAADAGNPPDNAEAKPQEQEYEEVVEVIPEEEVQEGFSSLENKQEWKTADGIRIIFGARKREMPAKQERASSGQESNAKDDGFLGGSSQNSEAAKKDVYDLVVMMIR